MTLYEQAVKARQDAEAVKARALDDLRKQKAQIEDLIRDLEGKTNGEKKRGRPPKKEKGAEIAPFKREGTEVRQA